MVVFSRDNLSEFVKYLADHVNKIDIHITDKGDYAELTMPFDYHVETVHSGQFVDLGERIGYPDLRTVSIH